MIEQASLVIGEGNWAVKSDSLLGYKINNGKYYPREMSVVRATTGTRINEDGLVEVVPYNLLSYSEQFNNAAWSQINSISVTANTTTAPNGTLTADTLLAGITASVIRQNINSNSGSTYTFSVWIKKASGNPTTRIRIEDNVAPYNSTAINVTPTNDWVRYEITRTIGSSANNINADIFPDFVNGTGSVYIWGAQLVEGSSALDYLPTTDRLDVARIDYSSGSAALLVEPQRTNLLTYSSSFDNAAWTKLNASVIANDATAPDGTLTADKITNSSLTNDRIQQLQIFASSGARTISLYAKAGTANLLKLQAYDDTTDFTGTFDLSSGIVVSTSSGVTASILPSNNDWYRLTISFNSSTNAIYYQVLFELQAGTRYIWGAQLEAGSYATSYIPTQGSAVTRNADVISKTGIADLIGQTEGTLYVDVDFKINSGEVGIFTEVTNGTSGQRVLIYYIGADILCYANTGVFSFTQPSNGRLKMAFGYKSGNSVLYVNGVQIAASTASLSYSLLSQFNLGCNYQYGQVTSQPYNAAYLFKTRLTNAELATLTTI